MSQQQRMNNRNENNLLRRTTTQDGPIVCNVLYTHKRHDGITTRDGLTDTSIGATMVAAAKGITTDTSMSHRQQTARRNRNNTTRRPNRMQHGTGVIIIIVRMFVSLSIL